MFEKRLSELQNVGALANTLSGEERQIRNCLFERLNIELQTIAQIFSTELSNYLSRTTCPEIWEKKYMLAVKKGWHVIGVPPPSFVMDDASPMIFVAVGSSEDIGEPRETSSPSKKGKNRLH